MIAYVTFGQRYRNEEHPTFPGAHPDGWITVEAESRAEVYKIVARNLCIEPDCTTPTYAAIYWTKRDLGPSHYPLGEIGRLDASSNPASRGPQRKVLRRIARR